MGFFSTTPAQPASPKPSADGAFEAPNRQSRRACWTARDDFFACLERNNIIDSIRESSKADEKCREEGQTLERECVSSWVTYFKQRRVMEHNKKQTLERLKAEGARPMPEGMGPPQGPGGVS
ncbi:hypothetical protein MMC24_001951 [Lignoscripta atroalba]|nr:hypothetical protein [Lignoscripta atroalba]